jgi:hypothetical protein
VKVDLERWLVELIQAGDQLLDAADDALTYHEVTRRYADARREWERVTEAWR